jgi:hypothetical protein
VFQITSHYFQLYLYLCISVLQMSVPGIYRQRCYRGKRVELDVGAGQPNRQPAASALSGHVFCSSLPQSSYLQIPAQMYLRLWTVDTRFWARLTIGSPLQPQQICPPRHNIVLKLPLRVGLHISALTCQAIINRWRVL